MSYFVPDDALAHVRPNIHLLYLLTFSPKPLFCSIAPQTPLLQRRLRNKVIAQEQTNKDHAPPGRVISARED